MRSKKLLKLALGGVAFQFLGLGASSCVSNAALTKFYTTSGNAAIDTFASHAAPIGDDFNAIVVKPTTTFLQNLWTTYVDMRIPTDPVYTGLLVE